MTSMTSKCMLRFFAICFLLCNSIDNNSLKSQCIDSTQIADLKRCHEFDYRLIHELYDPVCGCDGVTYEIFLCAIDHGVTEWEPGPCSCIDSTMYNDTIFQFNIELTLGHGVPMHQVCGCDGKTYLHPIVAFFSGVRSYSRGACSCIDSSVINLDIDISRCDMLMERIRDFEQDGRRVVKGCDGKFYDNICEAFYRHGVTSFVDLSGANCFILPEADLEPDYKCEDIYDPVCGCNRITYRNACEAEKHYGVMLHYKGECDCKDEERIGTYGFSNVYSVCTGLTSLMNFNPVCGCDSITYYNACHAMNYYGVPVYNNGSCKDCIDSTIINQDVWCDDTYLSPYCGCDGNVYFNACEAIFKNGVVGNRRACDCIESGLIDLSIDCFENHHFNPVCGCDGRTYPNLCMANRRGGVTRFREGACEDTCKDSILIIEEVPCSDFYDPVCGCDMITYTNECEARYHHGVLKWESGVCSVTSSANVQEKPTMSVSPNPARNELYLSGITNNSFEIYALSGQLLKSGIQQAVIDISFLTAGMYFIKLYDSNDTYKVFKISKI